MKRTVPARKAPVRLLRAELLALIDPILRLWGIRTGGPVQVTFLPNAVLRRLKSRHLKRRASFVNVLAFPEPADFPHPQSRRRPMGDIYLNAAYERSADEGLKMFIHGLAHLCGFNHIRHRDTIVMQAMERGALDRIVRVRGRYRVSRKHDGTTTRSPRRRYEISHRS